jgi:hypothetical protein
MNEYEKLWSRISALCDMPGGGPVYAKVNGPLGDGAALEIEGVLFKANAQGIFPPQPLMDSPREHSGAGPVQEQQRPEDTAV